MSFSVTKNGFYRRRRGILEHLEAGRISLFDAAVHDFLCLNAQSRVGTGSSLPPGIWFGSARKIWLLTGRQGSEKQIRRSLKKLEGLEWIKRWCKQGHRGDYPILVVRFLVRDASGKDFIVDAEETTDWRHPVLIPCRDLGHEPFVKRPRGGREASVLLQEGKNNRKEEKEVAQAQTPSRFIFEGDHLKVTQQQDRLLGEAFPWANRLGEYKKADSWLEANPAKRPRSPGRFLHNWFSRIPIPKANGGADARTRRAADLSRFDAVGRKAAGAMD